MYNVRIDLSGIGRAAYPWNDIHAPDADPSEREAKKLQYYLIILCNIVFNLDKPDFSI